MERANITSSAASLTGTIQYGVQDGVGSVFNDALRLINYNMNGDSIGSPREVQLFCDYLINYAWVDDVTTSPNTGYINILDDNYGFLESGGYPWPGELIPMDTQAYWDRLNQATSGGYIICLCIENSNDCDVDTCGWDNIAGSEAL